MSLKSSKKVMIILAVVALILVIILGLREYKTIQAAMNTFNQFDFLNQLRDQTPWDAVLLILLLAGFSIIPGTPVSVVAILTGVVFGQILGSAINAVGIILGNLAAQRIFLFFHEKADTKKTPKVIKAIKQMRHPMLGIIIGYMIPFIPTSVISLSVSDVQLSRRLIIIATIIGSIPMAVIYSFGGSALIESHYKLLLAIVLIIAIMLLAAYFISRTVQEDKEKTQR